MIYYLVISGEEKVDEEIDVNETIDLYYADHKVFYQVYTLDEYETLKQMAKDCGFKHYQIGPLVRSSYNASNLI